MGPQQKARTLADVISAVNRDDAIITLGQAKRITQRLRDLAFNIDPEDNAAKLKSIKSTILADVAAIDSLLGRIKL